MSYRTLEAMTIKPTWPSSWGTSNAKLILCLDRDVVSGDGVQYQGSENLGEGTALDGLGFYFSSDITVTNGVANAEAISNLPTTDTSTPANTARYYAFIYVGGQHRETLTFTGFHLHESVNGSSSTFTWQQWVTAQQFRQGSSQLPMIGDRTTMQAMIDAALYQNASDLLKGITYLSVAPAAAATPKAVGDNDTRVVDVTRYGTLAQAVAAIGPAQTTLQVTTNLTVSSNLTVPENIVLQKKGAGKIIVATGAVLTLARTPDVPRIQFFDQTGVSVADVSAAGYATLPTTADSHYVITSATANFVSGDVGGWVTLTGAGVGGATLQARIIARISATQARLDRAVRVASLSNATLTFRFGTVVFSGGGSKLGEILPEWWGANGDAGTTDNTRAFQLALNSVPTGGGKVKVGRGDFYIPYSSIFPKGGTTLEGEGESSKLYVNADEFDMARGWLSGEYRGLISVNNVDGVRVTGLRLVGNVQTSPDLSPKLIYTANAERLTVDHNLIEGCYHEALWQGGSPADCSGHKYNDNFFRNVGTAIQMSCVNSEARGNHISDAGAGILLTGSRITVTENDITLRDVNSSVGIYIGDNTNTGENIVANCRVKFRGNGSVGTTVKAGISVTTNHGSSTENYHPVIIANNHVHVVGTAADDPQYNQAYRVNYHHFVSLIGNYAEIDVRGHAFQIFAVNGGATNVVEATVVGNTAQYNNESGASNAFYGLVQGAGTLRIRSANNRVLGMAGGSSYAYRYDDSVGTVEISSQGDITEGGNVLMGGHAYLSGGELDAADLPIYDTNNKAANTMFLRSPRVGMWNLQPPSPAGITIAGGVLTLTGNVATFYPARRTRVKVDTEGGAASDDLDTISTTGMVDGDILVLTIVNSGRNVVLKDGTGNIQINSDFTLDTTNDVAVLMLNGATWICISKQTN